MQAPELEIVVSVQDQRLDLFRENALVASFPVSTSGWGLGTEPGSNRTPTGRFTIGEKIGDAAPAGAVFRSRLPTGELGRESDPEDLVQTRILWLEGVDPENANTKDRYIYIHGTNHEKEIGRPVSHGCVRMRNRDVVALFERVGVGTPVRILA